MVDDVDVNVVDVVKGVATESKSSTISTDIANVTATITFGASPSSPSHYQHRRYSSLVSTLYSS